VRQVEGSVKCDSGSTVAGGTRLVAGASGIAPDDYVRFPGEFFITTSTFALVQVLNFGSLAYVADCYGELRPLHGLCRQAMNPCIAPSSGIFRSRS
jgi:hypothetical protein